MFLDGQYESAGSGVLIPHGVDLIALHPRKATLHASAGDLLELTGRTRIVGLALVVDLGRALFLRGAAQVDASEIRITGAGKRFVDLQDQAQLTLEDSELFMTPPDLTFSAYLLSELDGVGALIVKRSKLHGCVAGIYGQVPKALTVADCELYDFDHAAIDLFGLGGNVTISGSSVRNTNALGIIFASTITLIHFELRNSEIAAGPAAWQGNLWLDGAAGSTFDLGTFAEPGGNVILGGSAASAGVTVHLASALVSAVGNTWVANQQGADAQGKYVVSDGDTLELSGPLAIGFNYGLVAGAKLRLAQSAP